MIARVKEATPNTLRYRRNAYVKKHQEFRAVYASGARADLDRATAELGRMAHPIFEAYTLHPVGWVREQRPKTKEQAGKWVSAIRRGLLPVGAYIFARPGSGLLLTGALVGIMFTE
jgi:hypothetical protein